MEGEKDDSRVVELSTPEEVEKLLSDNSVEARQIEFSDAHADFEISVMAEKYGASQRGVIATKSFNPSDHILSERPKCYVSARFDEKTDPHGFFSRDWNGNDFASIPKELDDMENVKGKLVITLTAEMILQKPLICELMVSDSEWAFFGMLDEKKYESPERAYEIVKKVYYKKTGNSATGGNATEQKKRRRTFLKCWPLETFTKLYAVIQTNAQIAYSPLSVNVYGAGIFTAGMFFNHSCQPNAMCTVRPGKLVIQAIAPINAGDEITVAYKEFPLDLLSRDMVKALQYSIGLRESGCCCTACQEIAQQEKTENVIGGEDTTEKTTFVTGNLQQLWVGETSARLSLDPKLDEYVRTLFSRSCDELGAAAAHALKHEYGYFLWYPDEDMSFGRSSLHYCPDLAFVLGEIYCTATIHIQGQDPDTYVWWCNVFLKAILSSRMTLPVSLWTAHVAACYAPIMACANRDRENTPEEVFKQDTNNFVTNWVMLKQISMTLFATEAYMNILFESYPIFGVLVEKLKKEIAAVEDKLQVELSAELQEVEAEAAAGKEEEEEAEDQRDMLSASVANLTINDAAAVEEASEKLGHLEISGDKKDDEK